MKDTTTIKTALLSFGMSGQIFHAPFLEYNEKFEMTHILERTKSLSKERYPNAHIVRSSEEIFSNPEIELIVVNTPDHTHFDYCRLALLAGKHVVIEKPFTLKYKEAKSLIQLADKNKLMLSVYQNRRWDNDFLTLKSIIENERIGEIVEFESSFQRFRPEVQKEKWREDPANGSGTVYNLGPHLIDQALVLFGKPYSVYAKLAKLRKHAKVDDYFVIYLNYKNHVVRLKASYLAAKPTPKLIVHGTKGSFIKYGEDPQENQVKNNMEISNPMLGIEPESNHGYLHYIENEKLKEERVPSLPGNYMAYYDGISRAIRFNERPPVTASEAAENIRIIEAVFKSRLKKREILIR